MIDVVWRAPIASTKWMSKPVHLKVRSSGPGTHVYAYPSGMLWATAPHYFIVSFAYATPDEIEAMKTLATLRFNLIVEEPNEAP